MKIKVLHLNCDVDESTTGKSLRDSASEFMRGFYASTSLKTSFGNKLLHDYFP
jgi:hypothetical protein